MTATTIRRPTVTTGSDFAELNRRVNALGLMRRRPTYYLFMTNATVLVTLLDMLGLTLLLVGIGALVSTRHDGSPSCGKNAKQRIRLRFRRRTP